jgi:hypothetical protein
MSAFSKSIFSNAIVPSSTRYLYNPVSLGGSGTQSTDLAVFDKAAVQTLTTIETLYGRNMAPPYPIDSTIPHEPTYENIPNDYIKYTQLYYVLTSLLQKVKNPAITLLLKLTQETLVGAINSYTIFGNNMALQLENDRLAKLYADIKSGINQTVVELANSSGQLSIVKTFTLAPVFDYYIRIYGIPAYGVGFDPAKIHFIVGVLTKMGIDPYK